MSAFNIDELIHRTIDFVYKGKTIKVKEITEKQYVEALSLEKKIKKDALGNQTPESLKDYEESRSALLFKFINNNTSDYVFTQKEFSELPLVAKRAMFDAIFMSSMLIYKEKN